MDILRHIRRYVLAGLCIPIVCFGYFYLQHVNFSDSILLFLFMYVSDFLGFIASIVLYPSAVWPVTAMKISVKGSSFAPDMALAIFGSIAICVLFCTSVGLATCRALREYRLFFILLALSAHGPWWGYMLSG